MKRLLDLLETKTADVHDLGHIAQAIVCGQLENKKLITGVIKAASYSDNCFPMSAYIYMKALRYVAGVDLPNLTFNYFDARCYHADQISSPLKLSNDDHRA